MQAPPWLADIAARVDARIDALLGAELDRWAAVDGGLVDPLGALRGLVRGGGKRLRPAFCYWAFVGAGGGGGGWVDAAAALELQHLSAIIHDDVIDDSARRHGAPTIHEEFAAKHTEAKWRGDHRRFGEGAAILIGNLAAAYADELVAGAGAPASGVFAELRLEVNAGQYLDLIGTAASDVDPEGALRICQYKSARYTVERPLHLGAALVGSGALAELAGPLSAVGLPLGTAFQLRDDLLDAFGDPAVTGKPAGADVREGKATYLVARARQAATGDAARFLASHYGRADLSAEEVARIQAILEESGARAATEATIGDLLGQAREAVSHLSVTATARAALGDLAAFVTGRDR